MKIPHFLHVVLFICYEQNEIFQCEFSFEIIINAKVN